MQRGRGAVTQQALAVPESAPRVHSTIARQSSRDGITGSDLHNVPGELVANNADVELRLLMPQRLFVVAAPAVNCAIHTEGKSVQRAGGNLSKRLVGKERVRSRPTRTPRLLIQRQLAAVARTKDPDV